MCWTTELSHCWRFSWFHTQPSLGPTPSFSLLPTAVSFICVHPAFTGRSRLSDVGCSTVFPTLGKPINIGNILLSLIICSSGHTCQPLSFSFDTNILGFIFVCDIRGVELKCILGFGYILLHTHYISLYNSSNEHSWEWRDGSTNDCTCGFYRGVELKTHIRW